MASSPIPGPVITFRFSQDAVSPAIDSAMQEVRAKTKATSEQVAEDWRRMAAQIRASVITGASSERDITNLRREAVSNLSREVDLLKNRAELTNKQLSSLKAMTLELERQKSFLAGTGGITTGTANALNQVSSQTILGFERILDSLVNRYLGGAAGAASRLIRDVTYYGSQAGGAASSGESGGAFGGIGAAASALSDAVGPATLAVGGLTAALVGIGAAAGGITLSLAKQNEQFENLAAVTGLSSRQVQVFSELAKENELDISGVTTAIARFQSELGEYVRKGANANEETNRFVAGAKALGVAVEDTSGKLRPPIDILSDLSNALRAIPDPADRSARALDILGVRGRELAPLLLSTRGSLSQLVAEISKDGPIIGDETGAQLDKAKTAWDALTRSMSATWLSLKEGIALGFLNATGFAQIGNIQATPQQALKAQAARIRAAAGPLVNGQIVGINNDQLIQQANEISGGGHLAVEIEQKRKELSDAIKDNNGVLALSLAQQVKSLQDVQAIENSRLEIAKRLKELSETGRLNIAHPTRAPQTADQVLNQLLNPTQAPNLGNPGFGNASQVLGTILGASPTAPDAILKQIADEHDALFTTQYDKDKQHYQEELDALNFALNQKLISQQQYNDASAQLSQNWAQTQQALNKKFTADADKLFDDLISGNTKSFSKALEKDIEDIVTQPIRKMFDNIIEQLLGSLNQAINGTGGSGPGATGGTGSIGGVNTSGGFGTIFGGATGIGSVIFNALGIKARPGATTSTAAGGGQFGIATQTMTVTAGVVYVLSGTNIGGGGALGLGGSSFFGNNNPFGGNSTFFGNNSPFATAGFGGLKIPGLSGGSASGGNANLATIVGGLVIGGTGAVSGNIGQEAIGAAVIATAATHALAAAGRLGKNGAAIAGKTGSIFGGAGLVVSGVSQGGAGGAVEDIAGGAEVGSAFGPIGTAVGAGVGALIALGNAIFGRSGWQKAVANAQKNQAIYLPPSENFSFASNGSISSTLGTGFSRSGSSESTYGLGNLPFYASAIYGPLTNAQKLELQQQELGLNSNQPFLGGNGNNIFNGVQPSGYRNYPTSPLPYIGNGPLGYSGGGSKPAIHVHFELPGYVTAESGIAALTPHVPKLAQMLSNEFYKWGSGLHRIAQPLP